MIGKCISAAFISLFLFSAALAQDGWQKFSSFHGKFNIDLPCRAGLKTENITVSGQAVAVKTYSCFHRGVLYTAAYADYSPGVDRAAELIRNRDDFKREMNGTLASERPILSGTGLESAYRLKSESAEGSAATRFFFVDNRLYALVTAKATGVATPMDNARFFSSFTLLPESPLVALR